MSTPHLPPSAAGPDVAPDAAASDAPHAARGGAAAPPAGVRTMAVVRWVIVALAAGTAAFSIFGYARARLAAGHASAGPTGKVYYCPMHPSVVQDHPGECPICNMTLVLRPAAARSGGAAAGTTPDAAAGATAAPMSSVPGLSAVHLTPERIQLVGMRTAPVKREQLGGELHALGVVAPSERGFAQINTRFAGWIEKLLVAETGTRVRRGQVLATIYSPEVLKAQQELLVARGWAGAPPPPAPRRAGGAAAATPGASAAGDAPQDDLAASFGDNARQRLELLGISPAEIDGILRTGKPVQAIPIRSPVEGYVIGKNAVAGLSVQPGTVLFEVADLSTVWVTADIYEVDVSRIRRGQRARFELTSAPGESHVGKVSFVSPTLDAQNRTLRIRLEVKNRIDGSGPRLRPGMYGTVRLELPVTTGLMVPGEAVVDTGERHYLFVAREGGHFEPRSVKVGARARDRVEILSGVIEGELVVTTGNFLIDSESRLRAAIEGQQSGATHQQGH